MSPKSIIATTIALAGAAIAQSLGSVTVVNSCSSAAYYQNVAGGSSQPSTETLHPGANFTQEWTTIETGGWSLKISQTSSTNWQDNILQLEYTWPGWGVDTVSPNLVFWDVSEINGSPWENEWELTATGDCSISQIAYLYPDDNGATQSCPAGDSVIISLCPNSGDSTAASSSVSSATSSAVSSTTPAASPSSTTTVAAVPTKTAHAKLGNGNNRDNVQQTTFATVVTPAANLGGVTVTEVATEIVTNFVTATNGAVAMDKRHEHVARHAHHHHH